MPSMTKTECRGHILALKNKVKAAWKPTPEVSTQEQERKFELIERHVRTELEFLNGLPETAAEVDYRMCLLDFVTYGSSRSEKFLTAPPIDSTNDDNNDAIINEYVLTHELLEYLEKETFLDRNHSGHWRNYLKSNPGITEKDYHQLMESQQRDSQTQTHPTTTSLAFFSPANSEGEETAEPITPRHQRR